MNTPRRINIFRALGEPPVFGHTPTVLKRWQLSKRHGATGLNEYAANGYLPENIINGLARLGWSHGNDEIFTRQNSWSDGSTSVADAVTRALRCRKVQWLNGEHVKRLPVDAGGENSRPSAERGYDLSTGPNAGSGRRTAARRAPTLQGWPVGALLLSRRHAGRRVAGQHLTDTNKPRDCMGQDQLSGAEWANPRSDPENTKTRICPENAAGNDTAAGDAPRHRAGASG